MNFPAWLKTLLRGPKFTMILQMVLIAQVL